MGDIVKFERRSQKLTGFLPPLVTDPPRALKHDPVHQVVTASLTVAFLALAVFHVWFRDGWRDR